MLRRLLLAMPYLLSLSLASCATPQATRPATELVAATATAPATASPAPSEPPPALRAATSGWATDWSRSSIALAELTSGGPPRDGIPPLDEPRFVGVAEGAKQVTPQEPVLLFVHEGVARAYPLAILMWHEIVNDEVAGLPVVVTFCPLCNSALVFERTLAGTVYDFGTSGLLRHSDLVMWDRQTESLWQQVTGEAIVGELAGARLPLLPAAILSFAEFAAAYPQGEVLSRETGHSRRYGVNPYQNYDSSQRPFLFSGEPDPRLPAMQRVVGLELAGEAVAYPFPALAEAGAINDSVAGEAVAILYAPDTRSALDSGRIDQGRAVGSAVAYRAQVAGQRLTFAPLGTGRFRDAETGSAWDVTGRARAGPLAGSQLEPLPHANHFWFAFAAFYPETRIWAP